jgi:hypothetical protein
MHFVKTGSCNKCDWCEETQRGIYFVSDTLQNSNSDSANKYSVAFYNIN